VFVCCACVTWAISGDTSLCVFVCVCVCVLCVRERASCTHTILGGFIYVCVFVYCVHVTCNLSYTYHPRFKSLALPLSPTHTPLPAFNPYPDTITNPTTPYPLTSTPLPMTPTHSLRTWPLPRPLLLQPPTLPRASPLNHTLPLPPNLYSHTPTPTHVIYFTIYIYMYTINGEGERDYIYMYMYHSLRTLPLPRPLLLQPPALAAHPL